MNPPQNNPTLPCSICKQQAELNTPCPICGFENKLLASKEEAVFWLENRVKPYSENYKLKEENRRLGKEIQSLKNNKPNNRQLSGNYISAVVDVFSTMWGFSRHTTVVVFLALWDAIRYVAKAIVAKVSAIYRQRNLIYRLIYQWISLKIIKKRLRRKEKESRRLQKKFNKLSKQAANPPPTGSITDKILRGSRWFVVAGIVGGICGVILYVSPWSHIIQYPFFDNVFWSTVTVGVAVGLCIWGIIMFFKI
ncbi:MAG: hypothetical protein FWG63_08610 [Defluviitaleaceae bacterium]|nr:hypothetical protein [Defluviitaleaceae bacterium]